MDREKGKVVAVAVVLALCVAWLAYYWISQPADPSKNPLRLPDSPAWMWAHSVNDKLIQDKRFADTSIVVVTDSPEKFRIVGMVHNARELAALQELLRKEAAGKDLDLEVSYPGAP
ncbi:MAG TPA: hypothetical protein PKE29_11875 [Phycisphaerales bacterium]|nr:hypothetical protein [Phycisphaerales bacterium]